MPVMILFVNDIDPYDNVHDDNDEDEVDDVTSIIQLRLPHCLPPTSSKRGTWVETILESSSLSEAMDSKKLREYALTKSITVWNKKEDIYLHCHWHHLASSCPPIRCESPGDVVGIWPIIAIIGAISPEHHPNQASSKQYPSETYILQQSRRWKISSEISLEVYSGHTGLRV